MMAKAALLCRAQELERSTLALIDDDRLAEAELRLASVKDRSGSMARTREFLRSQLHLRRGNYQEAIAVLRCARAEHGDHISLISNLACAHYLADDPVHWKSAFSEFREVFERVQGQLGELRRFKSAILLGQFFEEDGEVAEALQIYSRVRDSFDPVAHAEEYYKLTAQLLRLKVSFRVREGVPALVDELLWLRQSRPNSYLFTEVQHALMLFDVVTVGPRQAVARYRGMVDGASAYDRALLLSDLLEEMALRGSEASELRALAESSTETAGEYDRYLRRWIMRGALEDSELLQASSLMPKGRYLALLGLMAKADAESGRRLIILLDALSVESKRLWLARMGALVPGTSGKIREVGLYVATGELISDDHKVQIFRKKAIYALLVPLARDSSISTADAANAVWGESAISNSSYDERLRNIVHRANEVLAQVTGIPKTLRIEDGKIVVVPSVRLRVFG